MKKIFVDVQASFFRRRVWLLGVVGTVLATALFSWGISAYTEYRYQYILSQPEVLDAFFKNDEGVVRRVAAEYHLEYQRVSDGEVTFQSQGSLPAVTIVVAVTRPQKNVLTQDVAAALKSLRPRILIIERDIYLAFPLFSPEGQGSDGYVVYIPLFV